MVRVALFFTLILLISFANFSVHAQRIKQTFVGRWYSGDVSVCRGAPTADNPYEGSLVQYTATHRYGLENSCRITRSVAKGSAVELTFRCSGEGNPYTDQEVVEVVGNRLRTSSVVQGRKTTFTLNRCP
jgi:hypothetical protein